MSRCCIMQGVVVFLVHMYSVYAYCKSQATHLRSEIGFAFACRFAPPPTTHIIRIPRLCTRNFKTEPCEARLHRTTYDGRCLIHHDPWFIHLRTRHDYHPSHHHRENSPFRLIMQRLIPSDIRASRLTMQMTDHKTPVSLRAFIQFHAHRSAPLSYIDFPSSSRLCPAPSISPASIPMCQTCFKRLRVTVKQVKNHKTGA